MPVDFRQKVLTFSAQSDSIGECCEVIVCYPDIVEITAVEILLDVRLGDDTEIMFSIIEMPQGLVKGIIFDCSYRNIVSGQVEGRDGIFAESRHFSIP